MRVIFEKQNNVSFDDIKDLKEYPYIVTIEKYSNSKEITIFRLVRSGLLNNKLVWSPILTTGNSSHTGINKNIYFAKYKDIFAFKSCKDYIAFVYAPRALHGK